MALACLHHTAPTMQHIDCCNSCIKSLHSFVTPKSGCNEQAKVYRQAGLAVTKAVVHQLLLHPDVLFCLLFLLLLLLLLLSHTLPLAEQEAGLLLSFELLLFQLMVLLAVHLRPRNVLKAISELFWGHGSI